MKILFIACFASIAVAIIGGGVLNQFAKPSDHAFSTSAVRLP
jgi:ActR/RegA family two-component response regulator